MDAINSTKLSKKERKKFFQDQKREEQKKEQKVGLVRKWAIIVAVLAIVIFVFWWLIKESSKPLPGQMISDMGREHVADISDITYNSNPPTSGKHFPVWAKKGVYDRIISDGHLIHSLEHGYVVISYNCEKKASKALEETVGPPAPSSGKPLMQMSIQVQGDMSFFTPQNPPEVEVDLPKSFQSNECKKQVSDLAGFLNDFERIVIVPRIDLDTPIALSAWTRLEKLNRFDKKKVKTFIEAFHNKGPEKTIE